MKIQTGHGMITLTALLAIYSISMVTSLPGLAISPILGDLKNIFKDASDLELQMLESLPSFIIVPFILLAGRLSLKINKKRIYNNVVSEKKKSIKPSTIIIASAVTIALVTGSILVKRYLDNK